MQKERYASTISYLTSAENAGLYKGLKELSELVGSYHNLEKVGGIQIMQFGDFKECNLDKDVELPTREVEELTIEERSFRNI